MGLRDEAVALLQELIRADTVNPPGNEIRAAELLRGYLARDGIECQFIDRDPWSGDLVDGEVWGRGALDMKGQVAASAVAFASLRRDGFFPSGDLLFVAVPGGGGGGVR